ncbi:unnamed protein product [Caenorhabditis bovis]|uniref:Sodium/potassium-transporting ATPase subunit beta n=1 Tax=Caenorhabditis bovis TaxID=2654633 RepID=A0A8S1EKU2_9PELO|nr:unnamed protein product [Caenorhabditis bovis]
MSKPNRDESKTLMNGNNQHEEPASFRKFLYDGNKGTILGRTGTSWCQITIFYIIFYFFLAAFWIGCLSIFLKTLDPKLPRFYGKGTIIGVNPGVGYQPWLKENPDSTIIKFNLRDPTSFRPYVDQMNNYLDKYNNTENTRDCGPNDSNEDLNKEEDVLPCRFDLKHFEQNQCGPNNEYGFKSGKPCVILSLNRLIGWRPVDYDATSVPEIIKDRYKKGSIAFNCAGVTDMDKEHIGSLKYIPDEGIDGRYYPYTFVEGYQQPIAMVRFDSIPRNKIVRIECRAYALNIAHDISARLGMVNFEVMIEDKPVVVKPDEN